MNRIDRLFGIATLLQAQRYVPAERIAEQFGISIRTVYRDIRALGEQGLPISFEPQRGYFLVQGYFLPPAAFTAAEANALLLLQALGTTLADRSTRPHAVSALQKVQAVLRRSDRDQLPQLADGIRPHVPEYADSDTPYLAPIQAAIASRRALELDYRDKAGQRTRRRIEPIGLAFYNFSWHLVGWCHLRQAYREFRVSRLLGLTSTTLPFIQQPLLSLADYIASLNLPYAV